MKKNIFFLFFLLSLSMMGQITHTSNGNLDKKAETILKKAAACFTKEAVSFNVTMVNYNASQKETARQKVQILYRKGAYRATLAGQQLMSDGTTVWHWNKEAKEVVVNRMADASDDLMNPAAVLASYDKNFRPKYIRTEADGYAVIDLAPKKSMSYHKLRLFVNEKTGLLKKMEIHNYDSSRGEYVVSDFKSKVKCSDADFRFDAKAHKDVEVIDMR